MANGKWQVANVSAEIDAARSREQRTEAFNRRERRVDAEGAESF
jgi:hypothetical protein